MFDIAGYDSARNPKGTMGWNRTCVPFFAFSADTLKEYRVTSSSSCVISRIDKTLACDTTILGYFVRATPIWVEGNRLIKAGRKGEFRFSGDTLAFAIRSEPRQGSGIIEYKMKRETRPVPYGDPPCVLIGK